MAKCAMSVGTRRVTPSSSHGWITTVLIVGYLLASCTANPFSRRSTTSNNISMNSINDSKNRAVSNVSSTALLETAVDLDGGASQETSITTTTDPSDSQTLRSLGLSRDDIDSLLGEGGEEG